MNVASLQGMQSLCKDVSGNTSELVNSSASSKNIAEEKSENCSSDFEAAFHFEDFEPVGQDEECPIESTSTTDHTFIQYCAKVMQTIIDEYRDISAIFNEILPSMIY